MPKCTLCSIVQNKLNKGKLCKTCFNDQKTAANNKQTVGNLVNEKINSNTDNDNDICLDDRNIIDLIKQNMHLEKQWHAEVVGLLKDQVSFLKNEISHKNTLIENLIIELSTRSNNGSRSCSDFNNDSNNASQLSVSSANYDNTFESNNSETSKPNMEKPEEDILCTNRFKTLIIDEDSDSNDVLQNNGIKITRYASQEDITRQKINKVNTKAKHKNEIYNKANHVPGNSSYSEITRGGKKILILSDSLCSRIRMKEFNQYITNGYAYRKNFPGATPKDIAHYCLPTLIDDKPDTCIIHVGTNSLNIENPKEIVNDILNIVEICRSYGVNDIYVSGITYRENFQELVSETNNLLRKKQLLNHFSFIENDNISAAHIWRDKLF